jgi:hypothetical protein
VTRCDQVMRARARAKTKQVSNICQQDQIGNIYAASHHSEYEEKSALPPNEVYRLRILCPCAIRLLKLHLLAVKIELGDELVDNVYLLFRVQVGFDVLRLCLVKSNRTLDSYS